MAADHAPKSTKWLGVWLKIATFQSRFALPIVAIVLASAVIGLLSALRLTVNAGFEHLLPDGKQSVVELKRVAAKTAGVSTLFVVIEAPPDEPPPRDALRRASTALTRDLRALGEPWVGTAENGVHDTVKFLEAHAGLYVTLEALEKFQEDVSYHVNKELGTLIEEKDPPPELRFDEASIKKRFGVEPGGIQSRYPDGYFESADGRVHIVAIRSKVLATNTEQGKEAIARVRAVVDAANITQYHPSLKVGLAGDLYSGIAEVSAISEDMTDVGILGGCMIAGIVLLFYLRLRTLTLMIVNLLVGLLWTAGLTYYLVSALNTGTGFVFTILAGNGINTSIIYMARYIEARREGVAVESSLATAHRETFGATLCASAASAASFASLLITSFRGFRELGLIGGVGLMLCWVATLITLPSLLVIFEKLSPLDRESPGIWGKLRAAWAGAFGRPFAWGIERYAPAITVIGGLVTVAGIISTGYYVTHDPMEYDMNNMRNDPSSRMEESRLKKLADSITGYVGSEGMAILVERVEQVPLLKKALYARRDAAPDDKKPFAELFALEDFVPRDQAAKLPILEDLRKKINIAIKRRVVPPGSVAQVRRFLPEGEIKEITLADLPQTLALPFTEADGTRGRIVYISPTSPDLTEDARYLFRWADSYRETKLEDGSVVYGSGRAVIYADMLAANLEAVPVASLASFLAVLLVVVVVFRAGRRAALVIGALLAGVAWMGLALTLVGAKVNFLNFVALPITFGIGVDYAVNVVYRIGREGPSGAHRAVRETGGAVVLCSLTTTLGYMALIGSMNFAVRSLGVATVIGEVATLLVAMLVLPAAIHWYEKRGAEPIRIRDSRV